MKIDPQASVTRLIGQLAEGNSDEAARRLWECYFDELVRLARANLGVRPRGPADAEDAALSEFDSLCREVSAGRYPRLGDRHDLWRLLATITPRKAADLRAREGRKRRGAGRVLGEADLGGSDREGRALGLAGMPGPSPTPEFVALMGEGIQELFDRLPEESLRLVALLKLESFTNQEIATSLDCAVRSVERKLERIRAIWTAGDRT